MPTERSVRARVIAALITLYIVWGSTYLAIRYAVTTIPPFFMAGVRFLLAGGIMYLVLRARGVPNPSRASWRATVPIASLLLVVGNGVVCWAEQWVPSGVTALILASTPLWMVVFPWMTSRHAPSPALVIGLLAGFAGVGTLVVGVGRAHSSGSMLVGTLALLAAAASWSAGSLWSRRLPMPQPPFMSTAVQMIVAGPLLLVLSVAHGELGRIDLHAISGPSLLGFAYLVVGGSIVGFGAYVWLFAHTTPARATTYAFVNPVIAVLLGWAVAGEPMGARTLIAMVLIVASVVIVLRAPQTASARRAGAGLPKDPAAPGRDDRPS